MTHVDPSPPEASQRRPTRGLLEFVLLLLGAEICRHLDVPVRAAGVLFALGAVVVGILLLARRLPSPRSQRSTVVLALGLAVAVGLLLWHLGLLAVGPLFGDYEVCLDRALTREAEQSCRDDLTRRLDSFRIGGE